MKLAASEEVVGALQSPTPSVASVRQRPDAPVRTEKILSRLSQGKPDATLVGSRKQTQVVKTALVTVVKVYRVSQQGIFSKFS